MTDTDAGHEQPTAKQRRHVYIAMGLNAALLIFSIIAVTTGTTVTENIGIGLWVVALFVSAPAFAYKSPELKKLISAAMIIFFIATVALFISFAAGGTYDSLDLF